MNFRSPRGGRDERLDITPLVDVVFLLLIFFLITSSYVQDRKPNIPIDLPVADSARDEVQPANVMVHISKDGSLFLDDRPMDSVEALTQALAEVAARDPGTLVLIGCDARAPFGIPVEVMDAAKAAGLTHFGIVTREP